MKSRNGAEYERMRSRSGLVHQRSYVFPRSFRLLSDQEASDMTRVYSLYSNNLSTAMTPSSNPSSGIGASLSLSPSPFPPQIEPDIVEEEPPFTRPNIWLGALIDGEKVKIQIELFDEVLPKVARRFVYIARDGAGEGESLIKLAQLREEGWRLKVNALQFYSEHEDYGPDCVGSLISIVLPCGTEMNTLCRTPRRRLPHPAHHHPRQHTPTLPRLHA